jgi:hypothetical protein
MSSQKPPATHGAYRGVLLGMLAVGLFLFWLVVAFPFGIAIAEFLRDAIEGIHDAYDWKPF